jgi:hypothetical protein
MCGVFSSTAIMHIFGISGAELGRMVGLGLKYPPIAALHHVVNIEVVAHGAPEPQSGQGAASVEATVRTQGRDISAISA